MTEGTGAPGAPGPAVQVSSATPLPIKGSSSISINGFGFRSSDTAAAVEPVAPGAASWSSSSSAAQLRGDPVFMQRLHSDDILARRPALDQLHRAMERDARGEVGRLVAGVGLQAPSPPQQQQRRADEFVRRADPLVQRAEGEAREQRARELGGQASTEGDAEGDDLEPRASPAHEYRFAGAEHASVEELRELTSVVQEFNVPASFSNHYSELVARLPAPTMDRCVDAMAAAQVELGEAAYDRGMAVLTRMAGKSEACHHGIMTLLGDVAAAVDVIRNAGRLR